MSANYGRRLFTWGHCPFFLYYGLLLHGVCACFHISLALYQVSTQRTVFSFYGAGLRPFWCVSIRSGALFTEQSCTIKRRKKNKKKRWKRQPGRLFFFGMGSCLSFLYASALLFRSDANIGKWDKLEEIHSPG
ncbi:hypothetical protein LI328DRAFT_18973 [Trichoderma asperelloides]|nr:hypothetical protein LI328DRAFT_18973 [Trichoderma asperelloides]